MRHSNIYGLPEPLVSALSNDLYVKAGHISVTGLIQPPRIRQLTHRYHEHLEEDVSDKIWMLLGSAVHDLLERADTQHSLQEERLSITCNSWTITGKADLYEEPGILSDFKITSVWSGINGVKPDWEAQINLYAHLYRHAGFSVNKGQVVCIYRDWQKNRAKQGGNYPPCAADVLPVELWTDEQVQSYINYRVSLHQLADNLPDSDLPECTPEERWEQPPKYAVMKKGRKSAVRLFDTQAEALAMIEVRGSNHYLVIRQGQSIRCQDYCAVAPFCDQYFKMQMEA